MSTERKVMLIAGGSGSVGSAIARSAAAEGWHVAIHGRNEAKLAELTSSIEGARGIALDIHDDEAAATLVAQTAEQFGQIDAVIDCSATGPGGGRITGLFKDTTPEQFGAFLDLSAGWFQRLAHAAYPHLAKQGGTLIAFVSDAGRFAAPNQSLIGAARAATIGFVRNLSLEAARDAVRVHCISPSYVAESDSARKMGSTRMAKAASRAGLGLPTAEDIAPLALFLCGDGASKMTGQIISVNGGLNA